MSWADISVSASWLSAAPSRRLRSTPSASASFIKVAGLGGLSVAFQRAIFPRLIPI
nr:MAG TPA: hypothetical protein [Caudoviricetes sp.]